MPIVPVTYEKERMETMSSEDFVKVPFPARVVFRKQGGGWHEVGEVRDEGAMREILKVVGLNTIDRIGYYKKVG